MKHILQQNQQITSNSPQLALLKQQFPQCFDRYGAFMPHKLQELVQASGLALSTEGYSLNWLGKSYARLLANQTVQTFLQANTAHNSKSENQNSQNMLIKGDNLEVLKHLSAAYRESVKMIYIDPPYNTGSDGFVYQDDRRFTAAQLVQMTGMGEEEARRILEFTQSKSNSHSAWLTFMYPRLHVARRLLRDDGVIFISIDDNEQAQLKLLCDEVFGEENFVANIVVQTNPRGRSLDKFIAKTFEYIVCYTKNDSESALLQISKTDKALAEYDQVDEHGAFRLLELRNRNPVFNRDNRPNLFFPIYFCTVTGAISLQPIGNASQEIFPRNSKNEDGCWTWSQAKVADEKNILVVKQVNTGAWRVFRKDYIPESGALTKEKSLWLDTSLNHENGKEELSNLFGTSGNKVPFSFPKSVDLLKKAVAIGSDKNDLILDFFAGSGTTAHAVMQLNAEDGGNRRYICVQLDEATDPKSEAFKAGYRSIYDITAERIQRAAAKIRADHPDYAGDLGFQQFSTIPVFDGYLDPIDLNPQFSLFNPSNLTAQDRQNLMLTWQAADAIPLTQTLVPVSLGDYTAYLGTANSGSRYLYALEPNLNLAAVVVLLERLDHDPTFSVQYLVALGYQLDSKAQREISEAIHHYQNRKGIELKFDIRF